MTNNNNTAEYEKRSYEDLSLEFQRLYPSAVRAFELIPLMYNRLTLVDKLPHKEAYNKIYDDHRCLSGFSTRNISRYLPSDNPSVPRRVRTSCPKNSYVETNEPAKLSITQQEQSQASLSNYRETTSSNNSHQSQEESNKKGSRNQITEPVKNPHLRGQTVTEKSLEVRECPYCQMLSIEIDELKEALTKAIQFTKADQIPATEIRFTIPKDKYPQLTAAIGSSTNSVYVTFDKSGILERAEPEIFRGKLHNE
jgi:hypothetical protein